MKQHFWAGGPGNFSTAIVEWPDGKVENVPVENVRFLDAHVLDDDIL